MIVPDFCPDQWIAFIVLAIFVFGAWLHHISKPSSVSGVMHYYNGYATYYKKLRENRFILPPFIYGIVWSILYPMIFVAIFIFYYYDDVCHARSNNRFYDELTPSDDDDPDTTTPYVGHYRHGLEMCVWILFVINMMLNKLWDTAISCAYPPTGAKASESAKKEALSSAAFRSTILTSLVFLTAAALTVVTAIVAHGHPSKNLIIVPVFFGLYAAWTFIATILSIRFAASIDEFMK